MHSLTDFRSTENNRNKLVPCYSLPVSQYLSSPSQSTQHQQLKHHYHQQQQQQQQEKQQQQEEKQQPQQQLNVQAADSNEGFLVFVYHCSFFLFFGSDMSSCYCYPQLLVPPCFVVVVNVVV